MSTVADVFCFIYVDYRKACPAAPRKENKIFRWLACRSEKWREACSMQNQLVYPPAFVTPDTHCLPVAK
jgi:hypothetical protein